MVYFNTTESLYSQAFQILPLIILITNVEAVDSTLLKLKFNLETSLFWFQSLTKSLLVPYPNRRFSRYVIAAMQVDGKQKIAH